MENCRFVSPGKQPGRDPAPGDELISHLKLDSNQCFFEIIDITLKQIKFY